MGPDDDPRAVVDENGKVRRVDGPYAGDASIMPDVPSVAINSTVILMAETVADRVKARSGEGDGPTSVRSEAIGAPWPSGNGFGHGAILARGLFGRHGEPPAPPASNANRIILPSLRLPRLLSLSLRRVAPATIFTQQRRPERTWTLGLPELGLSLGPR